MKVAFIYLLSPKTDHKFIAQIVTGEKKVDCVIIMKYLVYSYQKYQGVQVHQILGLRVEDVVKFANSKVDIHSSIPTEKQVSFKKLFMKHWLNLLRFITLLNSLIPQEFNEFVKKAELKSEKHFVYKRVMSVDAVPEFVNLFKNYVVVESRFELI